jgi:hypothetical protein
MLYAGPVVYRDTTVVVGVNRPGLNGAEARDRV